MPPMPSVSVILPTFNRASFIAEAIRSVLIQTVAPVDFIVVDDGSTDGTEAVVAQFGMNLTYIRQENAGKLTAIATGLDRCGGDLVWIMDDDDIATPDAIALLATPFAGDPALVLSYGRMSKFDDAGGAEEMIDYPADDRPFMVQMMEGCFITGHPCVMARRDALEAMRPFDTQLIASVDYYLHLGVAMQGQVAAVDALVLRQRQHAGLRGPEHHRYGEAERVARWIAHDAYLLDSLLTELPMEAFLDPPPWDGRVLSEAEQRRAQVQKAVIAGRKKLWPRATYELVEAMQMEPDRPLDDRELDVLAGLLGSRYGFDEVIETPDILDGLRRACAGRCDRAAALSALARPLLHEIKLAQRELDARRAARAVRCWVRLMDLRATQVALQSSVGRNLRRAVSRLRR